MPFRVEGQDEGEEIHHYSTPLPAGEGIIGIFLMTALDFGGK